MGAQPQAAASPDGLRLPSMSRTYYRPLGAGTNLGKRCRVRWQGGRWCARCDAEGW